MASLPIRHFILPFAAVLLWGGNAVVTKAAAEVIAPAEISFYRWLIAAILLAPFAIGPIRRNPTALRVDAVRLIILGFLGCALFPYLMYAAAHHISAINIGIIQTLMPLFAFGLAWLAFGEAIGALLIVGSTISAVGVAVVLSDGDPLRLFSTDLNRGDLIMLAATACFALYSVLLKRWRTELPLVTELFVQTITATCLLFPFFVIADRQGLNATNLPMVLYAGALASIVAPLVWMQGIAHLGANRASVFFNFLPVVTAILAVALLNEPLSLALLLGGLLVIIGVAIAGRGQAPQHPK